MIFEAARRFLLIAGLLYAAGLAAETPTDGPPTRELVYRLEPGSNGEEELRRRFGPGRLALLEKLNRADVAHLARLPVLVVPEDWLDDELQYSPCL